MPDVLSFPDIVTFLVLGAAAGFLAGLLGIGGGLIVVAALVWLLPAQGIAAPVLMQVALATALAGIVFTAMASTRAHWRRRAIRWQLVSWLAPGLLLGGLSGAVLATVLAGWLLAVFVAVYCLLSAAQLAWGRSRPTAARVDEIGRGLLAAAGLVIGAISAVVGIGGGSMTVPLLVWRGVPPVQAVATSAACGVLIALASVVGYIFSPHEPAVALPPGTWGYVHVPAAVTIALASVVTAPQGATLAHRLPPQRLRQVFAAFLVVIAVVVSATAIR